MEKGFLDRIRKLKNKAFELILGILYPPTCIACGELIPINGEVLCADCRRELEREKDEGCLGCGKPFYACRCKPEYLSGLTLLTALPYKSENSVARELILYSKRRRHRGVFRELARHMALVMDKNGIGREYVLTYSPRAGVRGLGHDQAKEICRELSRLTGNPMVTTLKCRDTHKEQKTLKLNKRRQNAYERYRVPRRYAKRIAGKPFIMVDDVVTSGATAERGAKLLLESGGSEVICFCAARTVGYI